MSRDTLAQDLGDFLVLVARINLWFSPEDRNLDSKERDPEKTIVMSDANIFFKTASPGGFEVRLYLLRHNSKPVFLITKFAVSPSMALLDPLKVIRHLGRREYKSGDEVRSVEKDVYSVQRPADLETLFRAYDRLAKLNGVPTIFNLPQ